MNTLIQVRKANKSCETCKFREFDAFGWSCLKHNKWFDDDYACYDIGEEVCKYHKRDVSYCLSNGHYKYQERNGKSYYYKRGKFIEYSEIEF